MTIQIALYDKITEANDYLVDKLALFLSGSFTKDATYRGDTAFTSGFSVDKDHELEVGTAHYMLRVDDHGQENLRHMDKVVFKYSIHDEELASLLLSVLPPMYKVLDPKGLADYIFEENSHEALGFLSHPNLLIRKVDIAEDEHRFVLLDDSFYSFYTKVPSKYIEEVPSHRLLDYHPEILYADKDYNTIPYQLTKTRVVARPYRGIQKKQPSYLIKDRYGYYKTVTSNTTHLFSTYLGEQIRVRYAFFDRPSSGLSNVIMDSFFPRLMYKHGGNRERLREEGLLLPSTAVAISPYVAEFLNVKKVPTEQLCRVLGYTTKDIKQLLVAVKAKQKNFVFVGAGGTGMNTAYWLSELMQMTNTYKIFSKVAVFEDDVIEHSNMLRFPLSSGAYAVGNRNNSKLELIVPLIKNLGSRKLEVVNSYLTRGHYMRSTLLQNYPSLKTVPNTVLYGAPGIGYRDDLAEIGPLICATHADVSCSIWINPKQNMDIQVETYGIIQLGSFFMNQLQMTLELLKLLISDQDLSEQDKHIMDFSFDGTLKLRPDRNYHWQLEHNNLVMTDTEANNF